MAKTTNMEMRFLLGVLFILSCGIMDAAGSTISLSSSPASLMPGLTQSLSLSCSINDTAASSSLVGRDLTASNVNNTAGNLLMLTSLVMMRDNVDIAMVTTASPAHALADKGKAIVTGTASGSSGVRGHLDVVYQDPASDQAGTYSCEASGVDDHGHHVALTTSVDVVVSEPGISDLVNHIHDLTNQVKTQQTTINTLVHTNIAQQQANSDLNSKLIDLESQLSHIEQGTHDFGDSMQWPLEDSWNTFQTAAVNFTKPYPRPPLVHLSVDTQWQWPSDGTMYQLDLVSVDESGFVMGVHGAIQRSDYRLRGFAVSWLSFPQ